MSSQQQGLSPPIHTLAELHAVSETRQKDHRHVNVRVEILEQLYPDVSKKLSQGHEILSQTREYCEYFQSELSQIQKYVRQQMSTPKQDDIISGLRCGRAAAIKENEELRRRLTQTAQAIDRSEMYAKELLKENEELRNVEVRENELSARILDQQRTNESFRQRQTQLERQLENIGRNHKDLSTQLAEANSKLPDLHTRLEEAENLIRHLRHKNTANEMIIHQQSQQLQDSRSKQMESASQQVQARNQIHEGESLYQEKGLVLTRPGLYQITWAFTDIDDPHFDPTPTPLRVLEKVREQHKEWRKSRQKWDKVGKSEACIHQKARSQSSKWEHGKGVSCRDCTQTGRVCVVLVAEGLMALLPVAKEQHEGATDPGQAGYWMKESKGP